ncbi:MAG TPA: bifunctional precorrin-2 dehydrogenase/sirohydrochlorin ferrochelatase [bacterium]|nr:bifunctional precorrin-2 dehydrogenase/sirohydrochlorin ferrochelatase [bacterium]HQL60863.1 bifunctional precorrin-2 dehydrogenase/sirohydrochlorin ferrochelatase [bacterium]
MTRYPLMLELTGRTCLVVGGGAVALRKIRALLSAGARVRVVAEEIIPELRLCATNPELELKTGRYESGDMEGAVLAISAADDPEINRQVSEDADRLGIPVNVVDDPKLCTFTVPAVLRRGDLLIAVSTGGKCPALSVHIRNVLEHRFGPEYAAYVDFLGRMREWIRAQFPDDPVMRRKANRKLVELDLLDDITRDMETRAEEKVKQCILSLSD